MPLLSFTFIYRHLPPLAFIHLHLPPLAFIHGHLHSLAFFYLHTPTSTTISLHLPSSTSAGFHDSPEIIQRIVVPSNYSFMTNVFPCPLIFRHYTYYCPLSSFDTHPRWQPVTQRTGSRRSYGKIGTVNSL